jgi:hypothetical protein
MAGCAIISGSFERHPQPVVLAISRPEIYERDDDGEPGAVVGRLERKAGDTLVSTGFWRRPRLGIGDQYFLVVDGGREVFILRNEARTYADIQFDRLGRIFRLPRDKDAAAWGRAREYIRGDPDTPIEIATSNLIKTAQAADTNSIAYLVTRVEIGEEVEYEITCTSPKNRFNATYAARVLSFFMVTGKDYAYIF